MAVSSRAAGRYVDQPAASYQSSTVACPKARPVTHCRFGGMTP